MGRNSSYKYRDRAISAVAASRTVKNRGDCRRRCLSVWFRSLAKDLSVLSDGKLNGCCSFSQYDRSPRLSGKFSCLNPFLLEADERVQQDFRGSNGTIHCSDFLPLSQVGYLLHILVLKVVEEGELEGKDGVSPSEPAVECLNSLIFLDFGDALTSADVESFPFHLSTHPHIHQFQWIGEKVSQGGKSKCQQWQSFLPLRAILHRYFSHFCGDIEQSHLSDKGHISPEVRLESIMKGHRCITIFIHTIDLCCLISGSEKVDWICLMDCTRSSGYMMEASPNALTAK